MYEYWWRFKNSNWMSLSLTLVAVTAAALLCWFVIPILGSAAYSLFKSPQSSTNPPITDYSNLLKALTTIVTALVAIISLIYGWSRSLMPGSTRAVRTFLESTRDPMEALTCHFNSLIRWIGQPVAVFIDDVDRCQGGYIVDLLEGIQTLFRDVPVTYVVAADRRWLCTSYEKAYETFAGSIGEPGRTVGHLFLDKIFQLSTSVPRLAPAIQADYWQSLLGRKEAGIQAAGQEARMEASATLERLHTEESILTELQSDPVDALYDQALREQAVIRLATPNLTTQTEHRLQPFAALVEPNPRAMKRLVNAYGAMRAIDILKGGRLIEPGRLALWTIVTLRWPVLAEYLEIHPEIVRHILHGTPVQENHVTPEHVRKLLVDSEVARVIRGQEVGMQLDEATIRSCANLPPSEN